jgi:monoamine oxidase
MPAGGFPGWSAGLLPALQALVMPAVALAMPQAGVLTRVARAAVLETMPVDALARRALDDLSRLLDLERPAIDGACVGTHAHLFGADRWSRGAYTYSSVGGATAPEALQAPVDDTLFFAGEYTDPEDAGTVEAALASGRRSAAQVLERLDGRR